MTRGLRRRLCIAGLAGVLVAGASGAGRTALAQSAPSSARNIVLCHGDGPPCDTSDRSNGGGDEHLLTAFVTDAAGAPVAGVPVEFREQGQGRFTTGGDSVVVTTGSDGRAAAVVTSDEAGTSSLAAEISPPGTPGGFRGPATHDDECEQPSAPSGDPRAGNCVSAPLRVSWHVPPPVQTACSDGVDNDGDGAIDYPDDPSCVDEHDESEITSDPSDARGSRQVSIAFAHGRRDRMVVFGRVEVDGNGPAECSAGVPVRILRTSGGRWVPRATVTTSREGWYVVVLPDRPGRYRVSALRYEAGLVDDTYWTCRRAKHVKAHRHRG